MRLRPLSDARPKALLPVLNVPLIRYTLDQFRKAGVDDIWVNVHHQAEAFAALDLDVHISHERDERLGTAGALRKLASHLTEPFVVMNGDILCPLPIDELIKAHACNSSTATLAVVQHQTSDLLIDDNLVSEWCDLSQSMKPGWKWTGIAMFDPDILDLIPQGHSGLYESVLTKLTQQGRPIGVFQWNGYWNDIGTPSAYLHANLDRLQQNNCIDESASIDGCAINRCVIGRGAHIETGSTLDECVVWEGSHVVKGDYRRAIFTSTLGGGYVHQSEDE